ncbi:short chain dehydrogenase [Podospora fimiseda]|uniref:Short chain dehydrogenase n=1 Tax=Podospora fimiseda TaxID=252190 RepID=A0AAN7BU40_9PEZI|nr:short chain dehydrogenase [Podospora fimiseda]
MATRTISNAVLRSSSGSRPGSRSSSGSRSSLPPQAPTQSSPSSGTSTPPNPLQNIPIRFSSTNVPKINPETPQSLRKPVSDLFSLDSQVILVSGAARGVGLTQAAGLLQAGAKVHALDILPDPSLDPKSDFSIVKNTYPSSTLTYHRVDVRDQDRLNQIVSSIAEKEGRLDGLIAAAGIQREESALEYKKEDVDEMMEVNVTGVFMTAQAVAREMIKRKTKGSIVLIASMSGTVANRGLICPAYNASKAGVIQLARNLASEWGEHGIRVNTLSPGYIVTAMTAGLFEAVPERRKAWPDANMLRRLSYPEEYQGAAIFLLSDASSFMTGADLRIDGGHCAW